MAGFSFQQMISRAGADARPPETEPEPAPWFGPPDAELGETVPLSLVIGRSANAAVALRHVIAYTTGLHVELTATARDLSEREQQRVLHEQHGPYAGDSDAFLRLGVEFADGRQCANVGPHPALGSAQGYEPAPPVLVQHGGSGGGGGLSRVTLNHAYWLWPLPPPGQLGIFVEWPAVGIGLSSAELDTAEILDAAGRSQPLWND